jgi:hypothetical protein
VLVSVEHSFLLQSNLVGNVWEGTYEFLAVDEDGYLRIFQSKVFFFFVFEFLPGPERHFQGLVFDAGL